MSDLIVLGTDTDAGKTTFCLLWLAAFRDEFAYWKPVETGPSDTQTIRDLVPGAVVFPPHLHCRDSVAPPLAAKREGRSIPTAETLAGAKPPSERPLLIETFGGPFSPLNDDELQTELIRRLRARAVLVGSTTLGTIGRTLASWQALRHEGIDVAAIVLMGKHDPFAEQEIARHSGLLVFAFEAPATWDAKAINYSAEVNHANLQSLRRVWETRLEVQEQRALLDRDAATVWHPYTSLIGAGEPLAVVGAHDEFLQLADGRELIDGISSWWTILHGHRQPRLMAALQASAARIDHVLFAGVTHPVAVECAELLLNTAPWPGGRVFFSDNGSTAVEVALKMAYQWWCHRGEPQRRLFIGLDGCYHGDTFGAMAVSRDPLFFGRFEPLLFETARVPVSAERLDELLAQRGGETAAVIVEPLVQGAGGMRMHSPRELQALYEVARKHGTLFIADEVMTACRTGSFWAHTQAEIAPDLICAAKTLAGGVLPLAATLASPDIVAEFNVPDRTRTFFHGHSFTAHPLACAVAVENLRMIHGDGWRQNALRVANHWSSQVNQFRALPGVSGARVRGTILALDVGDGGYLASSGSAMRQAAIDSGVLLRPLGNVLYAMPPLCTSFESLCKIVDAMRAAVAAVAR